MPQIWLITGCSRGLGRALAEAVVTSGDYLVATARKKHELDELATKAGDRVTTRALDVTDFQAACDAVKVAVDTFGRLDVVANVAGYGNLGPIEDTSIEDFRAQIETNLFGVINMSKAAIPTMRKQRSGHIINFSSVGGRIGSTGRAPYSAAKFGLEGFSEVMATELAPLGIKVTIIEPGGFRTDFAGSSTKIAEVRAEYDSTVGEAARFQRNYNGRQPGDPVKAARVIIDVVGMRARSGEVAQSDPKLRRIILGSDAYRAIGSKLDALRAEYEASKDLAYSTDFEK
jgi:NAD(P)-dependent dehydrogenase (short-subunit alcohol dehydrogenase family)